MSRATQSIYLKCLHYLFKNLCRAAFCSLDVQRYFPPSHSWVSWHPRPATIILSSFCKHLWDESFKLIRGMGGGCCMSSANYNKVVFTPSRLLLSRGLKDAGCAACTCSRIRHLMTATPAVTQHRSTVPLAVPAVGLFVSASLQHYWFWSLTLRVSAAPNSSAISWMMCQVCNRVNSRTKQLHKERVSVSLQKPCTENQHPMCISTRFCCCVLVCIFFRN